MINKHTLVIACFVLILLVVVKPLLASDVTLKLRSETQGRGQRVYVAKGTATDALQQARRLMVVVDAPKACLDRTFHMRVQHSRPDEATVRVATTFHVAQEGLQGVEVDLPAPLPLEARWSVELRGEGVVPKARLVTLLAERERAGANRGGDASGEEGKAAPLHEEVTPPPRIVFIGGKKVKVPVVRVRKAPRVRKTVKPVDRPDKRRVKVLRKAEPRPRNRRPKAVVRRPAQANRR